MKGQVLLKILPANYTGSGIELPDLATMEMNGTKRFPAKAEVIATGIWKTTKQGYHVLPDFMPGQTVIVSHYVGSKLTRNLGENLRLCRVDDILAVLTEPGQAIV